MKPARRFALQLTPLLDLLLIVIFAQYLDVQQQADRQALQSVRQVEAARQELEAAAAVERQTLRAGQADLADERERLVEARRELDSERAEIATRVADMAAQQRRAADLVAELFNVPQALIDETLRPLPAGVPPRSPQETQRLCDRFAELSQLRGAEVIEFLLSYDELRKRADVWTLRLEATGEILFTAGEREQRFRAAAPEDFAARLFDRYKTLPQPKGLVVLLVSFGDARADARQAVVAGLPDAIRRLREDRLGGTQFEYAVLGYVPEKHDAAAE